ncbi:MAG: hypothetical protein IKO61_03615 [Lachnospiraceae bacterium]|nr:hypothetical protein [Lachnospiraceae bacterium]
MKLKKIALTITAGTLLIGALTACGDKKTDSTTAAATTAAATEAAKDTEAAKETETAAVSTGSDYVLYNDVELRPGMVWADVKDSLGAEAKPMEKIEPCGGGDYIQEMYFYDGLRINTLRSETILSIELPFDEDSDALIAGKIKMGDSLDKVKEVLGEPEGDEYQAVYAFDKTTIMIYLENGAVKGAAVLTNPE